MPISNLINKYSDIIILGRGPSLRNFKKKKKYNCNKYEFF